MMSSNVRSAVVKPSWSARFGSKSRGQPLTMPMMNGSGSRLIRPATLSPATRLSAAICSPTVADLVGERRSEHRDRGGEDHARRVAAARKPDRIQQHPRAVEVDAIALVEI